MVLKTTSHPHSSGSGVFPGLVFVQGSEQRNIVLMIPGRDRSRAVVMADHYDTAYMEDVFGRSGRGPRLAAAGADDIEAQVRAWLRTFADHASAGDD